jgi:ATP-binding cassette subfamily B protein
MIRSIWRLIRGEDNRGRKVRWLLSLLRPYRRQVAFSLIALVLATGATLAPPFLIGKAVSAALGGHSGTLVLLVAGLLAAALVAWGTGYLQTYLVEWVGERALQDLRIRIFTHLEAMSIGFFTRNRPGVLISRITNDVEALDQLISTGVVTLFSSSLTLIGVIVVMLVLDVKLALIVFLTFPVLALASLIFRIVAASAYRITRERIAEVTAYLQESLSGIRVVRSFAQEEHHVGRMGELNELNRQANLKTVYLNASYFPAVELLSAIGTAVILLYGGYQALDLSDAAARHAQIGIVVAFVAYLSTFFDPIQQLSNLYTTYQQGMAALDKIFDLLDTEPDMVDMPDAEDPGRLRGEIEMDGVWF